jgi:hypothetical protein
MWRFPLILFPLVDSLLFPLSWSPLLTWNPPCCDRIRSPWSQVARKLISPFPSLPICSPSAPHSEIPTPWGFPELMRPFTRTTLQHWLLGPAQERWRVLTVIRMAGWAPLPWAWPDKLWVGRVRCSAHMWQFSWSMGTEREGICVCAWQLAQVSMFLIGVKALLNTILYLHTKKNSCLFCRLKIITRWVHMNVHFYRAVSADATRSGKKKKSACQQINTEERVI